MMNLYVGNLSYNLHEDQLVQAFEQYGPVKSVRLVTDRETGRPRGFGFVEMEDRDGGQAAIDNLDGSELEGRKLVVNEARPKPARR
jgi:RNA recognition motif-containing protein